MSESTNSKSLPLATPFSAERNPSISRELHQSRPLAMAIPVSSSPLALALPAQVRRSTMADNNVQLSGGTAREQQSVRRSSQPFQLPYGWVVEERPRPSNPTHVDRYYYEPLTKRQFRSLLSVKRHLAGQTSEDRGRVNKKSNVPLNEGTYIEPESGLRFESVTDVESFLAEPSLGYRATHEGRKPNIPKPRIPLLSERVGDDRPFLRPHNGYIRDGNDISGSSIHPAPPPMLLLESGIGGDQSAQGESSSQRPSILRHSVVIEGKSIQESKKILAVRKVCQSMLSEDSDNESETKSEEDYSAPVHSLTTPAPEKVNWVLSDPGGSWNPFINDVGVPESEKMKWAKAFVHSVRDGGVPKN